MTLGRLIRFLATRVLDLESRDGRSMVQSEGSLESTVRVEDFRSRVLWEGLINEDSNASSRGYKRAVPPQETQVRIVGSGAVDAYSRRRRHCLSVKLDIAEGEICAGAVGIAFDNDRFGMGEIG